MRFDVVTLFPELFAPFLQAGITRKAYLSGLVDVRLHQLREFASGNYRRIDDRPFGGGPGMVMMPEPLNKGLKLIQADRSDDAPVVLFSPTGSRLDHNVVQRWASSNGAVLICGRYEGLDQRFVDKYVTEVVSLGDFVMSGGEIAAMALIDAVARLQPGVLNDAESHVQDSFNSALYGLLDCPHYTRPEVWEGIGVPEVLLSGNHALIERWRHHQRVALTSKNRPDLIDRARQSGQLDKTDEDIISRYNDGLTDPL
jgi:tRNA (guanine37-N1)-methyltransferase